jgi:hypothetical protein
VFDNGLEFNQDQAKVYIDEWRDDAHKERDMFKEIRFPILTNLHPIIFRHKNLIDYNKASCLTFP